MSDTQKIRIILVDDHSQVHRAFSAIIEIFDDLELVAQGSTGEEAIQLCIEFNPDVVLMDVIMPGIGGVRATKLILENNPKIQVLALSSFQDASSVLSMIEAGAIGYVLKDSSIDDLANTIRAAHAGKFIFSSEVKQFLFQPQKKIEPKPDYGLTKREIDILSLMVKGQNNNEIAEKLTISISTVKFHVSSVLSKLSVTSRIEAVAIAVEQHLVTD